MRKLKLLCLLPSLCLASCSSSSFAGVYEFRLGKTDGAHFGLSVELKDDAYEKREGMKQMFMSADLGSEYSIETLVSQYIDEYPFLATALEKILNALPEDHRVDGYYTVTDIKHPKYGNRVKIGSDFIQELFNKAFPEYTELVQEFIDIVFPGKTISTLTEPDMIQLLACAYADGKNFTLQIPVSQEDLFQQLAWYGYLVDSKSYKTMRKLDLDKMPGPKGDERYGVHPSSVKDEKGNVVSSEVDKMNETFVYDFSRTYLYEVDEFGLETALGSFITITNDNKKGLFFNPFDTSTSTTKFSGKFKLNAGQPGEHYVDVQFEIGSRSKEASVRYTEKTGNEEGFLIDDGHGGEVEIFYKNFIVEPFEFRDFHDVHVGLTKV